MKLEEQYTIPTTDEILDLGMLVYCNQLKCLCIISKKELGDDGKCHYSFKKVLEKNHEYANFSAEHFMLYKNQKNPALNYAIANDGTLDVYHIAFHIPSKKWVVISEKEMCPETRSIIYTADISDPELHIRDENKNFTGFKAVLKNQPASNFTQNPTYIREFLENNF